jgi:hypothetical protein
MERAALHNVEPTADDFYRVMDHTPGARGNTGTERNVLHKAEARQGGGIQAADAVAKTGKRHCFDMFYRAATATRVFCSAEFSSDPGSSITNGAFNSSEFSNGGFRSCKQCNRSSRGTGP